VPHRWFINVAIFRENSDDIYAGIEFEAESDKAKKLIQCPR
jgi:isocitrate dehydrogenase